MADQQVRFRALGSECVDMWLLLALTFEAGLVDAAVFLRLDHAFAGNMTGNVLILGMGATGAGALPVAGPLGALLGFIAGAAGGGLILRRHSGRWTREIVGGLGFGAVLLIACALLAALDHPTARVATAVIAAVAMGLQACIARTLAVTDLTTVVVTTTLTRFATELSIHTGWRALVNRRSAAVVAILIGAASGATLQRSGLGFVFLTAAVVMALVAALGFLGHVRSQR